jgi:hypothetical protein
MQRGPGQKGTTYRKTSGRDPGEYLLSVDTITLPGIPGTLSSHSSYARVACCMPSEEPVVDTLSSHASDKIVAGGYECSRSQNDTPQKEGLVALWYG